MVGLTELIKNIGDKNMEYQLLSKCANRYKESRKHKDYEVTFITASEKVTTGKEAIIVWVDKDLLVSEVDKLVNT